MIEKMKKVTLLVLTETRECSLETLRELGVMHLAAAPGAEVRSPEGLDQEKALADSAKVLYALEGAESKDAEAVFEKCSPRELLEAGVTLLAGEESLAKERDRLERDREKLLPWGDFDPAGVTALQEKGWTIRFSMLPEKEFASFAAPAGGVLQEIVRKDKMVRFLVILPPGVKEQEGEEIESVNLPSTSLRELEKALKEIGVKESERKKRLASLALESARLKAYREELEAELEFTHARDNMVASGAVAYMQGYIPLSAEKAFVETAEKNHWAYLLEEVAGDDERVPTKINKPKWMKIIDPLFEFIGIAPGYRETDVSFFFLLAFPVFFGMIIGDSAYGLLFLISAIAGKLIFRKNEKAQLPLNLLILLSCFSIIWGGLTGSCLGLPRKMLPEFLQGLDFFADPGNSPLARRIADRFGLKYATEGEIKSLSNRFTQFICFALAAIHLISARLYKTALELPDWRSLNQVGWALLILGNFFTAVGLIVFPGFFPVPWGYIIYGVGLALILATIQKEAAMNLPFDVIGSFVDVLSYIRLFAVGLSGLYVAECFNGMAMDVFKALPEKLLPLGIAGLIFVALAGHILNIVLGFLGVLVHAIRLNTLEFSNHIGLKWAGIIYHPFSRKKD